jgi:hypothetical protein
MNRRFRRGFRHRHGLLAGGFFALLSGQPANAVDEIQVHNAGIATPGQFTIQQHLNYIPLGLKTPA